MNVKLVLLSSLYLAGRYIIVLILSNSLKLRYGLMLIMSYIRSLAIDEEDMTTHIFPPGMVLTFSNHFKPCLPVVCCYSILGSPLSYLWVEYGTVFTTPKLPMLVPA